jgi:hypothetical protein
MRCNTFCAHWVMRLMFDLGKETREKHHWSLQIRKQLRGSTKWRMRSCTFFLLADDDDTDVGTANFRRPAADTHSKLVTHIGMWLCILLFFSSIKPFISPTDSVFLWSKIVKKQARLQCRWMRWLGWVTSLKPVIRFDVNDITWRRIRVECGSLVMSFGIWNAPHRALSALSQQLLYTPAHRKIILYYFSVASAICQDPKKTRTHEARLPSVLAHVCLVRRRRRKSCFESWVFLNYSSRYHALAVTSRSRYSLPSVSRTPGGRGRGRKFQLNTYMTDVAILWTSLTSF